MERMLLVAETSRSPASTCASSVTRFGDAQTIVSRRLKCQAEPRQLLSCRGKSEKNTAKPVLLPKRQVRA